MVERKKAAVSTIPTFIFIQREFSLHALTGRRSADGQQCLFSSHMTPLASLCPLSQFNKLPFFWHPFMWLRYIFLWNSDLTVVVLTTESPKVCRCLKSQCRCFLERTGLWHLEWAGVNWPAVSLSFFHTHHAHTQYVRTCRCWQGHLLESLVHLLNETHQWRLGLDETCFYWEISNPRTWTDVQSFQTNSNLKRLSVNPLYYGTCRPMMTTFTHLWKKKCWLLQKHSKQQLEFKVKS